ncbi:MAG TPA: hypothetical protein DCM08_05895 [Microscillaceae bacterium]|jgi:hypothetical protein|nr:hypothetical protein [Microscillaceae bacterium]
MIESIEQLPLLGKVGLVVVLTFAMLWALNKLLTAILNNYEKLVDAQIRLNDSIKSLVVPELQKIGAHLHLLATEDNATINKNELSKKIDDLSQQLMKVSAILDARSNTIKKEV